MKGSIGLFSLSISVFPADLTNKYFTLTVGTVEMIFSGILKLVSSDLSISIATTGQLVTIYAVIYAIGTPIFIMITARMGRKKLLLFSLVVFIFSNVIAAISPNYVVLMISRIIGATSAGVFSVTSIAFASKIVPPSQVGRAIGITMMGYSSSLVLGVPLGTFVGEIFSWRITFMLVAVVSLLPLMGFWLFMPKIKGEDPVPLKTQFSILRSPAMVTGLLVTGFIFIGQFSLYTYLTPFLHALADFNTNEITIALLIYGIFGVLGSLIGGYIVDKLSVKTALFLTIGSRMVALFLLPLVGKYPILLFILLMVWGTAGWATTPANQAYLRSLAPKLAGIILAVNVTFMQLGIALGSMMGGVIISSHYSYASLSWFAGLISMVGLISFIFSINLSKRQSDTLGN